MSPTPILDLEQYPPAPRANRSGLPFEICIGAAVGVALLESGPDYDLLLWLLAVYVAVAIHELGHLFARTREI